MFVCRDGVIAFVPRSDGVAGSTSKVLIGDNVSRVGNSGILRSAPELFGEHEKVEDALALFALHETIFMLKNDSVCINGGESNTIQIYFPFKIDSEVRRFAVIDNKFFIETAQSMLVLDVARNSYEVLGRHDCVLSTDLSCVVNLCVCIPRVNLQLCDSNLLPIAEADIYTDFVSKVSVMFGCVILKDCNKVHVIDPKTNNSVILNGVSEFAATRDGCAVFTASTGYPRLFMLDIRSVISAIVGTNNTLVVSVPDFYDEHYVCLTMN